MSLLRVVSERKSCNSAAELLLGRGNTLTLSNTCCKLTVLAASKFATANAPPPRMDNTKATPANWRRLLLGAAVMLEGLVTVNAVASKIGARHETGEYTVIGKKSL